MYPEKLGQPVQAGYSNAPSSQFGPAPGPQEEGIASALKLLLEEIRETANLSENLKSSLGISYPSDAKNSVEPCSLRDIIRHATGVLRVSNVGLADTLRHLNT